MIEIYVHAISTFRFRMPSAFVNFIRGDVKFKPSYFLNCIFRGGLQNCIYFQVTLMYAYSFRFIKVNLYLHTCSNIRNFSLQQGSSDSMDLADLNDEGVCVKVGKI